MIKEIMVHLNEEGLEVTFRMDSGYFDEDILEMIESLGCRYVIKGKGYPTLVAQVTDPNIVFVTGEEYEYFFLVTNTELKQVPPNIITCFDENEDKMIATWNPGINKLILQKK